MVESSEKMARYRLPRHLFTRFVAGAILLAIPTVAVVLGVIYAISISYHERKFETEVRLLVSAVDRHTVYNEIRGTTRALGLSNVRVKRAAQGQLLIDDPVLVPSLRDVRNHYDAALIYVMNTEGEVVASTTYDGGKTLAGNNYAFRPYFIQAMKGNDVVYPAVGVTTGERGLYYSSPIFRQEDADATGGIIGVVVTKMGLQSVDTFLQQFDDPVAVVSPSGVVFATNNPAWLFRVVSPIDAARASILRENVQFGGAFNDHAPQALSHDLSKNFTRINGGRHAVRSLDLALYDDSGTWRLICLQDASGWFPPWAILISILAVLLPYCFGALLMLAGKRNREMEADQRELMRQAAVTYKSIFESAYDVILVIDMETGNIVDANEKTIEQFGYTPDEATRLAFADLGSGKPPFSQTDAEEKFSAARSEPQLFEWRGRRKNGELSWVETSLRRCTVNGVDRLLAVMRDITARKQIELDLRAAKEAAERASHAKTDFLTNMSHEIRTPLNGVIGMLRILIRDNLDEKQREYARVAFRSAESLLKVINDILDFSRISAGKLIIDEKDFDLCETVTEVAQLLASEATDRGILIDVAYEADIPRWVHGDPGRIRQVLVNLVGNAVKFTHQGSVTIGVDIEPVNSREGIVTIAVRDTGIGINAKQIEAIFEKFSQIEESLTRQYSGTGLGLSITRQLVELMGGKIDVESEVGKGSIFRFILPLHFAEPTERPAATPPAILSQQIAADVLLVEDDAVNQLVARKMLELFGCNVEIAANGRVAVERTAQRDYDIVFMDVRMPIMDGYEATGIIRERDGAKRTPIVAMTAHALEGAAEKCIAAGMDDYVAKPLSPETVHAALAKWVAADKQTEH
jgi:PAS domain S-box-containing protein